MFSPLYTFYISNNFLVYLSNHLATVLFISSIFLFLSGCAGSERFAKEEDETETKEYFFEADIIVNPVRLLVDESYSTHEFFIETSCYLFTDEKRTALINKGNRVFISSASDNLSLRIRDKTYYGSLFEFKPVKGERTLTYKGKSLKGGVKVFNSNNSIQVVNTIDLEEYLKGVLPKEMPLGKGNEYFEALKAQAICARTYTLIRLQNNSKNFDLFIDVRDQVYGGDDVKSNISDEAVDETKNMVLTFNGEPATIFYHSTCGGKTENVKNIFIHNSQSYLRGVVDGNDYCSISTAFTWTETYSQNIFVERLYNAGLIPDKNYSVNRIEVVSRFESGRVNELHIQLSAGNRNEIVRLQGNNIRSIIRTTDNRGILKSIWFDIFINSNSEIIINGKGYGHGVGLCQWGALYQSTIGINYKDILYHYFPGVEITGLND